MGTLLHFVLTYLLAIHHCASANEAGENVIEFGQPSTIHVVKEGLFVVKLPQLPSPPPMSQSVSITSNLHHGSSTSSLVVLYGKQSQGWTLTDTVSEFSVTLCEDFLEPQPISSLLLTVQVDNSTSSLTILVEWQDIALPFDTPVMANISSTRPATFLVNHSARANSSLRDRFVLKIDTLEDHGQDICMIVAVYNRGCPLHDRPETARTSQMFTTALQKATLTIHANKFRFIEPFYVSIVVLDSDKDCHFEEEYLDNNDVPLRRKTVKVSIEEALPYARYTRPIMLAIIVISIIVVFSCAIMMCKTYEDTYKEPDAVDTTTAAILDENDDDDSVDGLDEGEVAYDLTEKFRKEIEDREKDRRRRIKKGINRLKKNATLADNTKILSNVWFRRNRSRVYVYLVPLICLFYFVPAIQFAILAKRNEEKTGSLDLCYHNYQCAKPLGFLSDFNHVISNIAYVIFGSVFICLVWLKSKRLPKRHQPKHDTMTRTGLLQQLSIFYAMGIALMWQGVFSVCYHMCPTNLSLQFDTTMMYIMCILGYVKLYQFRHPDATANAYSTFAFLGVLVFVEAMALYTSSWWMFGPFLIFYVAMTIFIAFDCYYIGVGRLDKKLSLILAKDILTNWRSRANPTSGNITKNGDTVDNPEAGETTCSLPCIRRIRYGKRFIFATVFCIINLCHAAYTAYSRHKNPSKNVTNVVLFTLAGNLVLYLMYYMFRRNCDTRCGQNGGDDHSEECKKRNSFKCMGHEVCMPMSAGSFFAFLALMSACVAVGYYAKRSANRNLAPAESRLLNEDCVVLDFYDNHDLWHFFSAAGIFMAFLALLTVDDGLLNTPRDKIPVF